MYFAILLLALFIFVFSLLIFNKYTRVSNENFNIFEAVEARKDIEEAKKYMQSIALEHKSIIYNKSWDKILNNINNSWNSLKKTNRFLINIQEKLISLVPSSHWLIDNHYMIEKEVKIFRQSAKRNYHKRLPILNDGPFKGYPRIYVIAKEMIKCTGYHLDEELMISLLNAYQEITILQFNEICFFLDMIKASIIEYLSNISDDIVSSLKIKLDADKVMDQVLDSSNLFEDNTNLLFEKFLTNQKLTNKQFTAHVIYRLRQSAIDDEILRTWMIRRAGDNIDLSSIINSESQEQSRLQILVGSLVSSLREEASLDYEKLFQSVSYIEKVLNNDPIDFYNKMDFETRIEYHKKIQKLSVIFGVSETEAAEAAVDLSCQSFKDNPRSKSSHVGYYFTKYGSGLLGQKLNFNPGFFERLFNWISSNNALWYFGSIALITLFVCIFCIYYTLQRIPDASIWLLVLVVILTLIPGVTIGVEIVNFCCIKLVSPKKLPCIDLLKGIPDQYRTIVVMPVVLGSINQVKTYLERIESYFLSNLDSNLYFAILGDLKDSKTEIQEDDEGIINTAVSGINQLNNKYCKDKPQFLLFKRDRQWNHQQECFMGRERKRGILDDLNSLIIGQDRSAFSLILGDNDILQSIKYVITIDAGTELVRDSAKKLIGMIAHPLNMPITNKKKNIVEDGYTIIQPRVGIRIRSALSTNFTKIFCGQAGIDTYTLSVADVYQDVFGKGTFGGKGIYDPRVFHQVISEELPENTILSHDLLEGCYVQCALASNVELMDDFPSSILSFFMREHRWVRGDWQLLPWLIKRNQLSGLSKYKIADNLRRSLIPINYLLLTFFAMWLFSWEFYVWGTIVLFSTLFPLIVHVSKTTLIGFEKYGSYFNILSHTKNIILTFIQGLVWFAVLPYRAQICFDAIVRTLYRIFISKKKMLEWKTAEAVEVSIKNNFISYIRRMWICLLSAILLIIISNSQYFWYALAVGGLWALAPIISYIISTPAKQKIQMLDKNQIIDLRLLSRKTWRYFEEFFWDDDNYIIPDNYQVWPDNGIAHRTSTTNIGLQLVCTLSARDFGYIGINSFINRVNKVFQTLEKLERWNGHFYNWYDTTILAPLVPKYVSTVDSGNFVGSLIVLKNGLNEIKDKSIFDGNIIEGLKDTYQLAGLDFNIKDDIELNTTDAYKEIFVEIKNRLDGINNNTKTNQWMMLLDNMCGDFLKDYEWFKIKGANEIFSLSNLAKSGNMKAVEIIRDIEDVIDTIDRYIKEIDFRPLYDEKRNVFRIGYNVTLGAADNSYYDLLASEARLASFVAIAKGDIPQKHWFSMGRALTLVGGKPTLVSWSGTMFEYLMPNLFMKTIPKSILSQTVIGAVARQIQYAKNKNIPWGMSEAAYYRFDQHLNYQYRAIGVPGLGFSSDLGKFLVIAPYATLLALKIAPKESYKNIQTIKTAGCEGDYGFYEAVDFLASTSNTYKKSNVIKSFFAHHQGMSLISLCNYINSDIMQKRFHNEPIVRATELLLEEKQPSHIIIMDPTKDIKKSDAPKYKNKVNNQRVINCTKPPYPIAHILSNNIFSTILTSTGSGYSWFNNRILNRWRADATSDSYGTFFYIKDLDKNKFWSSTYQPTLVEPDVYEAVFNTDRAEFKRTDGDIDTKTEVIISPGDNVEIRKITITNNGSSDFNVEVTSFMELTIDKYANDLVHPAFSKLFVETEYLHDKHTLLAVRRPRESEDERKWVMHTVLVDGKSSKNIEYETDRVKFIGRGNNLIHPDALTNELQLSNTAGRVLDTIFSLRVRLTISPGKSKTVAYITGIADNRDDIINLAFQYRKPHIIEDCFKMAAINNELELQYLDILPQQASSVLDMVGNIIYPSLLMRGSVDIIKNNKMQQKNLWRFGISGDYPIIVLRISNMNQIDSVRDIILAYEYLSMKGLKLDLVILNEQSEGYLQELNNKISDMISSIKVFDTSSKSLGAYLLQASSMQEDEINLILTVARIVISGNNRLLSKNIRNTLSKCQTKEQMAHKFISNKTYDAPFLEKEELMYFNGIGGFANDGQEYVIMQYDGVNTPAPWINVISNETFGFIVSASSLGYTWAKNSRENKLTHWSNDSVTDEPAEAIYIRDEYSGKYFTTTALPYRESSLYKVRHGFGYSIYEHNSNGLEQKTMVFASVKDNIKIYKVWIKNCTNDKRNLSLTHYANIVLGVNKDLTGPYIVSSVNNDLDILYAQNTYSSDFPSNTVFIFSSEKLSSYTADREEFIGNGSLENPQAMKYKEFSNKVGAGLDSCFAVKVNIDLEPNQEKEIVFGLGYTEDAANIKEYVDRYINIDVCSQELQNVRDYWSNILSRIKVYTPDISANYMLNGWILYQTLGCRVMARSGFYQSSGAYGFRDQLQDVISLLNTKPDIARKMIMLHSSRQFEEGDVQHWWHNDSGRGVRTRMSDDLLWLPYTVSCYIAKTDDQSILDEVIPFLSDDQLSDEETDRFCIPKISSKEATIYEHCIRAIEHSLYFGEHGLPLIGSGDWNDGMNKVGCKGRGESVWLGWFLYNVLNRFIPICKMRNDNDRAKLYQEYQIKIIKAIEDNGWDGEWYLRAFFDDGSLLGSKQNEECKIDSIAQSWSVISGGGSPERANKAMDSVLKYLVRDEDQIILLLSPPFDKSQPNPGYIKGYIPGIRENGGQYTHAAVWTVIAFAKLGRGDIAYRLFRMLNPINHTLTYSDLMKYKNEPYVMSADVYSMPPYNGRGGWSWYTGAAGWMYQAGIEWILGIKKYKDKLIIDPVIPNDWGSFRVEYIYNKTLYNIIVNNPEGISHGSVHLVLDGQNVTAKEITLVDDGLEHSIIATIQK